MFAANDPFCAGFRGGDHLIAKFKAQEMHGGGFLIGHLLSGGNLCRRTPPVPELRLPKLEMEQFRRLLLR